MAAGRPERKKRPQRYWEREVTQPGPPKPADPPAPKKPRQDGAPVEKQLKPGSRDRISGSVVPRERLQKFQRGAKLKGKASNKVLRHQLALQEEKAEVAAKQAARMDLLLLEDPGFLEGEEGEETCRISQADIADRLFSLVAVSAKKPVGCRTRVFCRRWLHTETMFAVAQRQWLYVYDNQGVELNCLKRFHRVQRMEFLPYPFLLATASETGFLQYLDVSVGKEVATLCTKGGRLGVMTQNPSNAIVHLGHAMVSTVTLWSPNVKEPLVRMLCHRGAVRALAVDRSGTYMATSGLDRKLHIYDLRAYRRLHSLLLPTGAGHLDFSQRGLLGAACQEVVQHGLRFCPFEDVLGVGHGEGFASLLVPGAGEPNFDALESNPFRSRKQRQEWEVKALLEKIPSELISLDPGQLGTLDAVSLDQQHQERVARLGFDPQDKGKFSPRRRRKGRDSAGGRLKRKQKVAAEEQRAALRKTLAAQKGRAPKRQTPREAVPAAQQSALDRFRK
ncbi:PREDICTED: WD repeat-containing protein 46 [Gekko japonicus]|uniref:WD repeat-containing protein 46 n=1 Tax=Gekko japonicus TaxID=146911 RepID=A0ABM1KGT2_GEKJA|nr:PREDICTED: WD repeat-containing protein 46 [Gekko japonicus]